MKQAHTGLALARNHRPEASETLKAAEAAYGGDFLESDLYYEWAIPLREAARATFLSVARELGRAAADCADYDNAVYHFLRLLEYDGYDEEAHLGLVSVLFKARRYGEATRSYATYAMRMREIDIEPTPFRHLDRTR